MRKQPLTREEVTELTTGLNTLARNLWWTWDQEAQEVFQELSPRGWQNLYHNAVAILHEVSDYELRVRLQEPDFAERARDVLAAFPASGLFVGGVRFPRNAAYCRRRPGHVGWGSRQSGQRSGLGVCGHQPVLPRRLFSTGDRPEQLADRILYSAQPQEPAARTGAQRERGDAGVPRGHRHEPGGFPGLAGQRRPRDGLSAGHQPRRKRTAFPRFDPAGLWRGRPPPAHPGRAVGARRGGRVSRAGGATIGLPHERRPRRFSYPGAGSRKDGRWQDVRRGA